MVRTPRAECAIRSPSVEVRSRVLQCSFECWSACRAQVSLGDVDMFAGAVSSQPSTPAVPPLQSPLSAAPVPTPFAVLRRRPSGAKLHGRPSVQLNGGSGT